MGSQGEPENVQTGTQHRDPRGVGIKKFQHFFGFFLHFSRFFCVIFNENWIENCKNNMP